MDNKTDFDNEAGKKVSLEAVTPFQFSGTVITLIDTAVGGGILAIPFAFRHAGVILGTLMVFGFAFLGRFMEWKIILFGRRFNRDTYPSMINAALGDRVGIFLACTMAVATFASLVGLLVLMGDVVTPIMQVWFGPNSFLGNRVYLVGAISILFVVPVATLPNVDQLKYTSFLTMVILAFMSVVLVIQCAKQIGSEGIHWDRVKWWADDWSFILSAPIIWFNTGVLFLVLPTLGPAQGPKWTNKHMAGVAASVSGVTVILMMTIGLAGYFTFYEVTNGNVLTNYPVNDTLIGVCRALVAVMVLSSYPLVNMPFREVLFWFWATVRSRKTPSPPIKEAEPQDPTSSTDSVGSNCTASTDVTDDVPEYLDSPRSVDLDNEDVPEENVFVPLDIDPPTTPEVPKTPLDYTSSPSTPHTTTTKKMWLMNFIQAFVSWLVAFVLANLFPDITTAIGFVGWCLSPIYYFVLPGTIALTIASGRKTTIASAIFMFCFAAYFEVTGFGTFFLPKLAPPPSCHTFRPYIQQKLFSYCWLKSSLKASIRHCSFG